MLPQQMLETEQKIRLENGTTGQAGEVRWNSQGVKVYMLTGKHQVRQEQQKEDDR